MTSKGGVSLNRLNNEPDFCGYAFYICREPLHQPLRISPIISKI